MGFHTTIQGLITTTDVVTSIARDSFLHQPRNGAREASIRPKPANLQEMCLVGATRCVTPRQTCPRPSGFGRNLRSKTRWFTGFCNSHQVSHFATFFIDTRAKISIARSHSDAHWNNTKHIKMMASSPTTTVLGTNRAGFLVLLYILLQLKQT